MKSTRRLTRIVLVSAATACAASAQSGGIPQFRRPDPLWSVSIGMRHYSGGADVKFSNLGSIPVVAASLEGNRLYDNGIVNLDALRVNEVDGDGNQTSTPGERHLTYTAPDDDGNVTPTGSYVAYESGYTRDWAFADASQATGNGVIGMDLYGATSRGGSISKESDSSAGFDFAMTRRLGKLSPKIEWGLTVGFGLSDLKAKSSGTVVSDLRRLTDYYATKDGSTPEAPYDAPTFIDFTDADGNVILASSYETTTPLNLTPVDRTDTTIPGGALIDGEWDIDGAYFLIRLGPTLRGRITQRLGYSFSAGGAAAYVGSTFHSKESLQPDGVVQAIVYEEETDTDKLVMGYYASANLEFWLTESTGVYAGASYESLADFEQEVGGRKASVDVGQGVAIRGGLTYRF